MSSTSRKKKSSSGRPGGSPRAVVVKPAGPREWIAGARLRTLPLAVAPVLIGTGALAAEIASALIPRHRIDQWGRRAPAAVLPPASLTRFQLFSAADPFVVQSTDRAVLVIAAPAGSTDLDRIAAGEISTEHLATHILPLDQGPEGYTMFKNKEDGCVRAVFQPDGASGSSSS